MPFKRSKYKNTRVKVDGESFHSQWEADYWMLLVEAQREGLIERLEKQVRYPLIVSGVKVGMSIIDFRFIELNEDGKQVRHRLQDTKGYIQPSSPNTQLWKLKHKIIHAMCGLEVEVILKKEMRRILDDEEDQSLSPVDRSIRAKLVAMPARRKPRREADIL